METHPEEKASLSIINSINNRKEKKPQLFDEKKGMLCPQPKKWTWFPNEEGHHSLTKKGEHNPLTKQLKIEMDVCWNLGIGLEHNYRRKMFLLINTINDRLLSKKKTYILFRRLSLWHPLRKKHKTLTKQ